MGYGIYNDQRYKAIITVGIHPTIHPLKNPIVEIHMLDFDLNIYGQYIFIEFVSFMRENKRFPDVKDLIAQLKKDKEKAKKTLQ